MTSDATIDYEGLHQEALRGLVRAVLIEVAKSGLPGDHHFYISYDVRLPGVVLSKRLREKYPTEMTIVLQHRFWDLLVSEERFEVKLTFDGIPERLVVPFSAIKVFLDPSVRFVLHFEDTAALSEREIDTDAPGEARSTSNRKRVSRARPRPDRAGGPPTLAVAGPDGTTERRVPPARSKPPAAVPPASDARLTAEAGPPPDADAGSEPPTTAQVVSLDQFRKK